MLAWIGCHLLSRSPIVRHDGPVSVAGAYTIPEVRELAERAGLDWCEPDASLAMSIPPPLESGMSMTASLECSDAIAGTTWDAVVVGAGPAGALAAHQLAVGGARVLLVEKKRFPRWKVCGACLNGQALAVLDSTGLGARWSRGWARLS